MTTTIRVTQPSCPEARRQEANYIEELLAQANDREQQGCDFEARRLRRIAAGMRGITTVVVCNAQSGRSTS
jgi:hypothetical protein